MPAILEGFPLREITVAGDPWQVAVANTPDLRRRGLMNVSDMGSVDGMLFVFPGDTTSGFWMKDTLLELEIAFFDAAGALVDVLVMEPCRADPCPTYTPSGAYRWALEAVPGPLGDLPADARLDAGG